jgi:asparagine synthase (glutamine-hydrolysing)
MDFYLPSVLMKVDRASMANSIEVRPALLDNELVAWAATVPSRFKVSARETKIVLRSIAKDMLPADIVGRPKKGFSVPLAAWLAKELQPLVQDVFGNASFWQWTGLNQEVFKDWNLQHVGKQKDNSKSLWALVVLHVWYQRVVQRVN